MKWQPRFGYLPAEQPGALPGLLAVLECQAPLPRLESSLLEPALGAVLLVVTGLSGEAALRCLPALFEDLRVWVALPEAARERATFRQQALRLQGELGADYPLFTGLPGSPAFQRVSPRVAQRLHRNGVQVWGTLLAALPPGGPALSTPVPAAADDTRG